MNSARPKRRAAASVAALSTVFAMSATAVGLAAPAQASPPAASASAKAPAATTVLHPTVASAVHHDTSPTLKSIAAQLPPPPKGKAMGTVAGKGPNIVRNPILPKAHNSAAKHVTRGSAAVQRSAGADTMPAFGANFEGVGNIDQVLPPDTSGAVGPNNYVQWVNLHFAVYDKSGNQLLGPLPGNALWSGFGGPCEQDNDGDIAVKYDALAGRWMMSQFALESPDGGHQCIAVSATGDPTGAWYRYDYLIVGPGSINDYPHFGVWPDAYYMSFNQFDGNNWGGAGAVAFERQKMLEGQDAQMVSFNLLSTNPNFGGQQPADLEGDAPPAGSPGYFLEADDDSMGFPTDELNVWKFHVDWANPANSTFGNNGQPDWTLQTAPFDSNLCNYSRSCITQPGTSQGLDALSDRVMYRLAYRNFGDHQSMVINDTVDVDGNDHAGIRWYELRSPENNPDWSIYQQGTYAPDGDNRWMGSADLDASGDMAIGFSVSSSTTYPSIRVAGRLVGDPLGQLAQGERELIAGGGSQTSFYGRWGDYSQLTIDPTDNCTFWYTQEYIPSTTDADWHTRIGSFKFPTCSNGPHATLSGTVTDSGTGNPIAGAKVAVGNASTTTGTDGTYQLVVPVGTYDITASAFGYAPQTKSSVTVQDGQTYTENFALSAVPQSVVTGRVLDGSGHGYPLYAEVSVPGVPVPSVYTKPSTGYFAIRLPQQATYTLQVHVVYPGYQDVTQDVTLGTTGKHVTVSVPVGTDCTAAGYTVHLGGPTQTFDSTSGPPGAWTTVDNTGAGAWAFDDPGARTNLTGGDGGFAIADSDHAGSGTTLDTSLISPVYNLSHDSTPVVQFNQDYRALASTADIDVSLDAGKTWTTALEETNDVRGPISTMVPLPMAAHQSHVRLRFHYVGSWAWWWEVDNVFVGQRSCVAVPGALLTGTVTDVNASSGLNGVKVTSVDDSTVTTTTMATPDDPRLPDGFYWLFTPHTGDQKFVASHGGYQSQTKSVSLGPDSVGTLRFYLRSGHLTLSTDSVSTTARMGNSASKTFTVTNDGTAAADVTIAERPGNFQILRQQGAPLMRVKGAFSPDSLQNQGGDPDARQQAARAAAAAAAAPYAEPWVPIANTPSAIMDNAVVNLDGKIYSIGGTDGTQTFAGGDVYDPTQTTWTAIAESPHEREEPSAAAINGKIYVVGGWGGDGNPTPEMDIYDPATNSWSSGAPTPDPRAGAASAVINGKWYVVGGCDASSCGSTGVNVYDPASDSWSTAASYPEPVSWEGCGSVDGSLTCAGGTTDAGTIQHGYRYDAGTDSWSPIADLPIDLWAMGYTGANGMLLLSGGVTNGSSTVTNQGFAYDPGTDSWQALPNSNNTVYRGGSTCGFYRVGGSTGGFSPVQTGEVLPGFDQCGSEADVSWLSETPATMTLKPGQSKTITVKTDAGDAAIGQPGTYTAQLVVSANTPSNPAPVDVTMKVTPPLTWGKITGTVTGVACDGTTAPLAGATVEIDSWATQYTLKTAADGTYALWLDKRNNPLTVIVAKDGYKPQVKTVRITALGTLTVNWSLKKAGC